MPVEPVGNVPPEADHIRSTIENRLPDIIASFNQVLREQYNLEGISVGGFTVVPEGAASSVTCDQDSCTVS